MSLVGSNAGINLACDLLYCILQLPYVLAYKSKNLGQICPLKIEGSTYMWVTDGQHMCHEFFQKADDVSWARNWRTLCSVAQRSGAVGHWHVMLVCVTWYCSKMNGRAGEEFRATLLLDRSPTWAWLADNWYYKQRMIVVAVLDAAAWRRGAPCCDQLLSSLQNTRAFRTAASRLRGMLLMASATSLTRRYTRGSTYAWVLNFGHFFTAK